MSNDKIMKPQTFGILSAAPDELAAMQELVAEAVKDDVTQFDLPEVKVPAGGGTSWEVPTLEGYEKLKIPRGTQPGRTFRLKGKGIAHLRGYGRGDQIIETMVAVPTHLTKKQEEILKEFDKLDMETRRPDKS